MTDIVRMTGPEKRSWILAGHTGQERARRLMEILRGPGGCPWDLEQSHSSLRKYLLEEAYELAEAIDAYEHSGAIQSLEEELGDVYLQVLFHARIGEQAGSMSIDSIADRLVRKMIDRHPHVFEVSETNTSSQDVLTNWESAKRKKNNASPKPAGFGHGLPRAMPALQRAQTLSSRAASLGFDWSAATDVIDKLDEELEEIKAALHQSNDTLLQNELGDLMLAVVNLARKKGWDAEKLMHTAADKFQRRFEHVLTLKDQMPLASTPLSPDQWDAFWDAAKHVEARENSAIV